MCSTSCLDPQSVCELIRKGWTLNVHDPAKLVRRFGFDKWLLEKVTVWGSFTEKWGFRIVSTPSIKDGFYYSVHNKQGKAKTSGWCLSLFEAKAKAISAALELDPPVTFKEAKKLLKIEQQRIQDLSILAVLSQKEFEINGC